MGYSPSTSQKTRDWGLSRMASTVYGRGSEWRRWDLHTHAPGTALADQFGDWDQFLDAVEAADPAIAVVGITDYSSINTYKTFKKHHDGGRMSNIAMAFPNIEFRISPETKISKGINLHLLISPDDPDHVDRIDEALTQLIIKRGDEDIACNRSGLIRLGRMTKPALIGDAAYKEGVNQFKVDFDVLRRRFAANRLRACRPRLRCRGRAQRGRRESNH